MNVSKKDTIQTLEKIKSAEVYSNPQQMFRHTTENGTHYTFPFSFSSSPYLTPYYTHTCRSSPNNKLPDIVFWEMAKERNSWTNFAIHMFA